MADCPQDEFKVGINVLGDSNVVGDLAISGTITATSGLLPAKFVEDIAADNAANELTWIEDVGGVKTTFTFTPAGIATNATNISTNSDNITTNTNNISTNTSNIATNTSDIAVNTAKRTYPIADETKVGLITITQAINLDDIQSSIASNTAKRSYPTADETKVGFLTVTANIDLDALRLAVATNSTKNSFPAADKIKIDFLSVTRSLDLDQMESDIAVNTAKRSYPVEDEAKVALIPDVIGTSTQILQVNSAATALEYVDKPGGVNPSTGAPNSWADYALSYFVETNTVDGNLVVTLDFTENSVVTRVYRQVITSPYTDIIFSDMALTTEITRR